METITTKEVSCNLCGSHNHQFLFSARDRLYGVPGRYSYVRCKDCGLVYMNPQVVSGDIMKLYPEDYSPHVQVPEKRRDRIDLLKKSISSIPVLKGFTSSMFKIEKSIYNKLNSQSRILDIGCGNGHFLHEVKMDKKANVFGIDVSDAAVREAKINYNIDLYKGTMMDAPHPQSSFDFITAWQFFEHVINPNEVVEKMSLILKPGGYLIMSTPNIASFHFNIFKDKWYHLDCPRHVCLWSLIQVRRLFEKNSLKIIKVIYDKTPWCLLGAMQYVVYGDNLNPIYKNKIRRSWLLALLFAPWSILLGLFRKSDTMVIYAQKN